MQIFLLKVGGKKKKNERDINITWHRNSDIYSRQQEREKEFELNVPNNEFPMKLILHSKRLLYSLVAFSPLVLDFPQFYQPFELINLCENFTICSFVV